MTCPHCASAKVRTCGLYDTQCTGCLARSIARSLVAWKALHRRDQQARFELREMVSRMLPGLAYEQARDMVMEWWNADHESEVTV